MSEFHFFRDENHEEEVTFEDTTAWPVFREGESIYVETNGAPGGDNIEIEWVCRGESVSNGMLAFDMDDIYMINKGFELRILSF